MFVVLLQVVSSEQHHYSYWSEASLELRRSHSSQIAYVSGEDEEEVLSEKLSSQDLVFVSDTKLELESAFTESGSTPPPEACLRPESQDSTSNSESQEEGSEKDSNANSQGPDSDLGLKLEPQDMLTQVSLFVPSSLPLSSVASPPPCGSLRTSNFAKVTASFIPETTSNPVPFTSFRASHVASVKRLPSESLLTGPRGKFQPKVSKFGKKSFTLKADTLQKRRDISAERSSVNSKDERGTEANTARMPKDNEQCPSPPSSPDEQKHSPEELATIQARVRASLEQQGVVSGS